MRHYGLSSYARDYYSRNRKYGQEVADAPPGVATAGSVRPASASDGGPSSAGQSAAVRGRPPLRLCPLCEHTFHGDAAVCERCDG